MFFPREKSGILGLVLAVLVGIGAADYQVAEGDTLSEIAREFGVSPDEIAEANGLDDPNLIQAGDVLVIPGVDGAPATAYTVGAGDTLSELARDFGLTTEELAIANGIDNPDLILVGVTLEIPVTGANGETSTVTHTVQPGETLSELAKKYGTSVAAIADANDISDPDRLLSGTALLIGTASPTTTLPPVVTHTVAAGESLDLIAARYGVPAAVIADANDISDPDRIFVGQVLEIPPAPSESATSAPPAAPAGMVCPVPGSRFIDDFGVEKPDGRYHQGIDMFAPRGTSALAPVSGELEAVNGTIGGLQYWLTGDDGKLYIGTHLDGFGKVGRVEAGDVIGIVGDSGNAIGAPPHLHLEILVDGSPINPYPKLAESCR